MGYQAEIKLKHWGWYPHGGGEVKVRVEPGKELYSIHLGKRRKLKAIQGISSASNLPSHVAETQARQVKKIGQQELSLDLNTIRPSSSGPGSPGVLSRPI